MNFRKEVYPILDRSCTSCHCQHLAQAGFRVDRVEEFFGTATRPAIIVRGDADASLLIAIVSGTRTDMPLEVKHRLPEDEVSLLKRWIDEGAELTDIQD